MGCRAIRIANTAGPRALRRQAAAYRRLVEACLAVRRCRSITMWGVSDGGSWIPSAFPGYGRALLFDRRLRPKLAYDAVRAALLRSELTRG